MRFIHTADWHLGRLFHGIHLTEDQSHVLGQFVDVVKDARADAVIIAGDLFDRAVPPPEAVELFDEVLCRLALDLKVAVVVIAGNHDSPQRVAYGARLFSTRGAHVFASPGRDAGLVELNDAHGPVRIYALPYAEPPVIRERFADEAVVDHDSAMRCCISAIRAGHPAGCRAVLVAHGFVAGGAECESERPLCVGGTGVIDAACLDTFNYVAMGHLHGPQSLGAAVHYSGSLLKYSFSEAGQDKSISVVEMDAAGACRIERVRLRPRHDVRCVKGILANILKGPNDGTGREDYIHVTLEDSGALLDPQGKLREVYPNVLALDRPFLSARAEGARIDTSRMSEVELFGRFFEQVTGEKISGEQSAAFAAAVDGVRQEEREAVA
jgi:DNA repair protein SbcD/Mre11